MPLSNHKMALSGHFFFVYFVYIMAGGILDNRKSRLITFLAISTFLKIIFRNWLFWMTKNHLQNNISRHFRSIRKMAASSHFGSYFFQKSIVKIVLTKWPQMVILDDRKSLSIVLLSISDQYTFFFSQNGRRRSFWMTENHF